MKITTLIVLSIISIVSAKFTATPVITGVEYLVEAVHDQIFDLTLWKVNGEPAFADDSEGNPITLKEFYELKESGRKYSVLLASPDHPRAK
jgi:hypothetical protein